MTGTDLETRLSAALHAKADLVTPESLPPLAMPEPRVVPFVRRPATWAVAAAASAVLIALPFVLQGSDERSERPPATEGPTPTGTATTTELTGDLDGDGYDETITLQDGTLSVVLASSNSGQPLTAVVPAGYTLAGLIRLDDSRAHQVVVHELADALIFRVTAAGLTQVTSPGGEMYEPFVGNDSQAWVIEGDQLLSAQLPMSADDRIGMAAQRWIIDNRGDLSSTLLGELCWSADSEHLRPCGGGSGVVAGDPALQVALFPRATEVIHSGESFPIAIDGGGGPGTVSLDGSTVSVDFPGGSPAQEVTIPGPGSIAVYTTFLPGVEVPGIVVRQTRAGGFDWFYVVSWSAGELTLLEPGSVPEGVSNQFYSGDDQSMWLSEAGHLLMSWPSQVGNGNYVVRWTLDQATLTAQFVTTPEGDRQICMEPPSYGGC